MKPINIDENLVSYCGLYCGACPSHLKEKCPGCHENTRATWCKVRSCCLANSHDSCGNCREHDDIKSCSKFNNIISKIFGFIFRSDRHAGIMKIRELGIRGFAKYMAETKRQAIRR